MLGVLAGTMKSTIKIKNGDVMVARSYINGKELIYDENKEEWIENNRFTVVKSSLTDKYILQDKNNDYDFYVSFDEERQALKLADFLNKQDNRIKELEHELTCVDGLWVSDKEDMSEKWRLDLRGCLNE